MHSVAAFFASIVTFVSGLLGSPLLASNSPVTVATTQPAAAQTAVSDNPFNDPAAASAVAAAFAAASPTSASSPPSQGRVRGEQTTNLAPFLSQFSQFLRSFDAYVASPLVSGGTAYPRYGGYLPQSDGTTALAAPSITGGTITNASSGSFDALSAGTLALSGALSGTDATFSGTLTAGTLNVAGITSQGALIGPYVTATSTTATSSFAGGLTVASSAFNILQNGRVGLGTAAPGARLDISGSGTDALVIRGDAWPDSSVTFKSADNSTSIAAIAAGFNADPALRSLAISTSHVNASVLLQTGGGRVGIGTTTPWGKLSIKGSGTGTGLAFAVADSANTPRFVIQDNGNVGIGTASPTNMLSVLGTGYVSGNLGLKVSGTTFVDLALGDNDTGFDWVSDGNFALYTNNVERMRFTAAGNVGIGTTTPSYTLDVGGFINTDGTAGGYKLAGNTVLYASTTNNTLAVGASGSAGWMSASSTQRYSIAIGSGALATTPTNGTAQYNTAVGYQALNRNTDGTNNTANGGTALYSNTTGNQNTAYGRSALYSNTTGTYNTAVGYTALFYNTSASNTTAIGVNAAKGIAAYYNQGGTVVGHQSGYNFTTGSDFNTLLGYQSGYGITTGARNVLLGHSTFATSYNQVTTGSNNIAIGNDVAVASSTLSNQLNIGNLIYGTGLSGTGATVSTGNVGIGTTSPTAQLHTTGTVRFSNFGAGTLTTDASGNLSVSSDERLKNIDGAFTRGLADIVKLIPISYHWNGTSGLDTSTQYAGFSAQNVQAVIPEAVGSSTSGYLTLQDRPLIAAVINAIKELASKLDTLATSVSGFADRFTSNRIETRTLCVADDSGETCVTRAQLQALLAAPHYNPDGSYTITTSNQQALPLEQAATSTATSAPAADAETGAQATSTPPTDTQATSTPSTDFNTQPPALIEDSNPFNAQPANDNASSATATDVAA